MSRKTQMIGVAVAALSLLLASAPLIVTADSDPAATPINCQDAPQVDGTSICLPNAAERMTLTPGKETTRSFTVKNGGNTTYSLEVEPSYFLPSADAGERFSHEGSFTEIRQWITLERGEFRNIAPGETITVNYTIKTPANAPAGAQYVGINVKTAIEDSQSMVAQKQLQYRIFARVSGETVERGEVVAFDIPGWVRGNDLITSVTMRNTGNTDYMADNTLIVKSIFGREVYRSPASNDTKVFLYPQSDAVSVELAYREPSFGLYNVIQQTALANGEIVEHTKLVLVAPIWMVLTFFVGLAAVITLIIIAIINRVNKKRHYNAHQ